MELELVDNFKNVELIINCNGSFKLAITELKEQFSSAMYAVIGKCSELLHKLSYKVKLEEWRVNSLPSDYEADTRAPEW